MSTSVPIGFVQLRDDAFDGPCTKKFAMTEMWTTPPNSLNRPTMLQSGSLRPAIFRPSRFVCLQRRSEVRNKSITAAIERGRTFGDRELDHAEGGGRVRRGARPPPRGGPIRLNLEPSRYSYKQPSSTSPSYGSVRSSIPQRRESRIDSLPFTTAASEFIYGYSSVLAAIKADRRKFHRLYIHRRGVSHPGRDGLIARAKRLVAIEEVGDEYLQAFDKASSGRPHNVGST